LTKAEYANINSTRISKELKNDKAKITEFEAKPTGR
jgi:hypothetical protein